MIWPKKKKKKEIKKNKINKLKKKKKKIKKSCFDTFHDARIKSNPLLHVSEN